MSEQQDDTVMVVDPNGNTKTLPRAAAESPDVIALGFKVIEQVDYGVQRIKHDAAEVSEVAADSAPEAEKGRPGRKPKAQA